LIEPAAVMPFVPEAEDAPALDRLEEYDVIRAAVFDYLIDNSDRDGRNWIGLEVGKPKFRLLLIDHGYTFGYMGRRLLSEFWGARRHEPIPDKVRRDVAHLAAAALDDEALNLWLEPEQVRQLIHRARKCVDERRLPANRD
jgi:hypothetical protein